MSKGTKISIAIGVIGMIFSILSFIGGFYTAKTIYSVEVAGDDNLTVTGEDIDVLGNQCAKYEAQKMVFIDTIVTSLPSDNINTLDENDRAFFERIKEIYGCYQDEGIKCDVVYLNIWNPFEEDILNNVAMNIKLGENSYEIFIDYLTHTLHTVGLCDAGDSTQCYVFPRYLLQNNTDKEISNIIVSEDGVITEVGKCERQNISDDESEEETNS